MEDTNIDWAQTRINIATAAMQSLLTDQNKMERLNTCYKKERHFIYDSIAIEAKCYADALIEQLTCQPIAPTEPPEAELIARAKTIRLEDLQLSVRAFNAIHHKGIDTMDKLIRCTSPFLLRYCRNLGKKTLTEIKECVEAMGYHFGMLPPYWIECTYRYTTEAHLSDLSDWKCCDDYKELCKFITESNKKILD